LGEVPFDLRPELFWADTPLIGAGTDANHIIIRGDDRERTVQVPLGVGILPLLQRRLDGRLGLRAGVHQWPSPAQLGDALSSWNRGVIVDHVVKVLPEGGITVERSNILKADHSVLIVVHGVEHSGVILHGVCASRQSGLDTG
jgi:hypothetical protein